MLIRATYDATLEEYALMRFSVEVPHFPRLAGIRTAHYNNTLLGRAAGISDLAEEMAAANRRCFPVECDPAGGVYERFLRALVTVDGLEYVTEAGRYFIAINRSPLHAVEPLCTAVVEAVREHFYPDHQVEIRRHRPRVKTRHDRRDPAARFPGRLRA